VRISKASLIDINNTKLRQQKLFQKIISWGWFRYSRADFRSNFYCFREV